MHVAVMTDSNCFKVQNQCFLTCQKSGAFHNYIVHTIMSRDPDVSPQTKISWANLSRYETKMAYISLQKQNVTLTKTLLLHCSSCRYI